MKQDCTTGGSACNGGERTEEWNGLLERGNVVLGEVSSSADWSCCSSRIISRRGEASTIYTGPNHA